MKGDFGTMVWVNDEDGHEYVCTVERDFDKKKSFSDLDDSERQTCMNVNEIVGTERW